MMKNKKKITETIIRTVSLILLAFVFTITFVESKYIPTWNEIFGISVQVDPEKDCITFLDVGQGDSILIQSNGRFVLVDTGDGDKVSISKELKGRGVIGLDAVILTHWHDDHIGGLEEILNNFSVLNLVTTEIAEDEDVSTEQANMLISLSETKSVKHHIAIQGMSINVGEFEITVLYYNSDAYEENNRSAVLMAKCGNKKFLLMADSESYVEESMINSEIDFSCDVIKLGHHGSATSNTPDFLKAAEAEYAVVSVGYNNPYNHPAADVISTVRGLGADVYRTDYNGDITFNVEKDGLSVSCE